MSGENYYFGGHTVINNDEVVVFGYRQPTSGDNSTMTMSVFRFNIVTDTMVWSFESTEVGKF
jgi:hypothetical protein